MAGVGAFAGSRGIKARGSINHWSTLNAPPPTATTGTDTTPVVTETYIASLYVPHNTTVTGLSLLNGSAAAGSVVLAIADADGYEVASTAKAGTAQSGTAAYQAIALTASTELKGPGQYFVLAQFNNTSARFRTHAVGVMPASKKTGEVFGTITTITPPTTFTTAQGPIVSTY